jgi:hypothetical protein
MGKDIVKIIVVKNRMVNIAAKQLITITHIKKVF